jgi:hypothetical protein
MTKILLFALLLSPVLAQAASVHRYRGFTYSDANDCNQRLPLIAQKIEASGVGQANNLEAYCIEGTSPIVTFVTTLSPNDIASRFKESHFIHDSFARLTPDDQQAMMNEVTRVFEDKDFYILEFGYDSTPAQMTFKVLSLNGAAPYLYRGIQYSNCQAKLSEIVGDLSAKFGKAAGICTGGRPLVFFVISP